MKILLVGDDTRMRRLASFGLTKEGDQVGIVSALPQLGKLPNLGSYDAAILDWEMRQMPAVQLIDGLRRLAPQIPVLVLTTSDERAADALNAGASEALLKPIEVDPAREALERIIGLSPRPVQQTAPSAPKQAPDLLTTRSAIMQERLDILSRVAPTPATVLLLGESGTGKTFLARRIHQMSTRSGAPIITVNCPCLQSSLLESELFGHVRGAFTGAVSDSGGLVAAAEGGTLFLDEIGELPLALQAKLLRLLQERCYERIGEAKVRTADIRIVAATNRNLREEVAAGRFREDLFYRLNVISVEVPALRQRPEEILPLAQQLVIELGRINGRRVLGFSPDATLALQRHPWPGNLRELRNCLERAVILCSSDIIDMDDLPDLIPRGNEATPQIGDFVTLAEIEEAHIRRVMEKAGSLVHAARLLGIDKTTLYRRRRRQFESTVPFEEGLRTAM